jgi:hypothetical protein
MVRQGVVAEMTLADQIIDHCMPDRRDDGFRSLLGATFELADVLRKFTWQKIGIAEGVTLAFPGGCQWRTSDEPDGGVRIEFTEQLPAVTVQRSSLRLTAEVTGVVLRVGNGAITAVLMLKRFPDFTATLSLKG